MRPERLDMVPVFGAFPALKNRDFKIMANWLEIRVATHGECLYVCMHVFAYVAPYVHTG